MQSEFFFSSDSCQPIKFEITTYANQRYIYFSYNRESILYRTSFVLSVKYKMHVFKILKSFKYLINSICLQGFVIREVADKKLFFFSSVLQQYSKFQEFKQGEQLTQFIYIQNFDKNHNRELIYWHIANENFYEVIWRFLNCKLQYDN